MATAKNILVLLSACILFGAIVAQYQPCTIVYSGTVTNNEINFIQQMIHRYQRDASFVINEACQARAGLKVTACDDVAPTVLFMGDNIIKVQRNGGLHKPATVDITEYCFGATRQKH